MNFLFILKFNDLFDLQILIVGQNKKLYLDAIEHSTYVLNFKTIGLDLRPVAMIPYFWGNLTYDLGK